MPIPRNRSRRRLISTTGLALALLVVTGYLASDRIYLAWKYRIADRNVEWIARYGYDEGEVLALEFGLGKIGIPLVAAHIESQPALLILDTGTRAPAALHQATMERLGLAIVRWSDWRDSAGQVQHRIPVSRVRQLKVGPLELQDLEIPALGPARIMGHLEGADGTLGWPAWEDGRITLDYANGRIAFSSSPIPEAIDNCSSRLRQAFVSPPRLPGLVLIPARIGGATALAEIDTGKSSTVIDRRYLDHPQLDAPDIRIGPFQVPTRHLRHGNLSGFDSAEGQVALGLGSDFLTQHLLTIDYPRREVVLEASDCPSQPAARP